MSNEIIFDNVVLNQICKQIRDPTTYFNFSILNKKCHRIAMLNQETKIDQFTRKIDLGYYDQNIYVGYVQVLPNNMRHGLQQQGRICKYFYFDKNVATKIGTEKNTTEKNITEVKICHCVNLSNKNMGKKGMVIDRMGNSAIYLDIRPHKISHASILEKMSISKYKIVECMWCVRSKIIEHESLWTEN